MIARFATRHPWFVVAVHLAVLGVAAVGLTRLRSTDDLLDFIPPGNADVKIFNDVNQRFGSLRVALVGVEAPAGDDVFAPSTLRKIDAATESFRNIQGVDRVVSLTSLVDFIPSEAVVQVVPLVDIAGGAADTPAKRASLKARVLAQDHVAGSFVSRDGRAALIMVFLAPPIPTSDGKSTVSVPLRAVASTIEEVARDKLAGLTLVFGGAPFASATIYNETQADIRHLTPIAVVFIFSLILFVFRDPVGIALTVASVAWAVAVVLGFMGLLGEPFTLVSATVPVLCFASGASYVIHILGRYYTLGGKRAGPNTMVEAARIVSPPVAIAGAATAAGFLSFLVMDIRPMRAFGVECAAGVLLSAVATLTLVPAVMTLWPRPGSPPVGNERVGEGLATLGSWAHRHRRWLLVGMIAAAAATVGPMLRVEVRMAPSAFFRPGSEPWKADRFMEERFGGAQFLQVALKGDIADPATLREIKRLVEFARAQANVAMTASIVESLELVANAMGTGRNLPPTKAQVQNLLFFVEGEPSLRNVLTQDRASALVQIRVKGDPKPLIGVFERYLREQLHRQPGAPSLDDITQRIQWIAAADGVQLPAETAAAVAKSCVLPPSSDPALIAARKQAALALLSGEGGMLPPVGDAAARERIAAAAVAAPESDATAKAMLAAVAPSPEEGDIAWSSLHARFGEKARGLGAERAVAPLKDRLSPGAIAHIESILLDILYGSAIVQAPVPIEANLAGEPMLDRGLSHSVANNQMRSLIVTVVLVFLLLLALFRSLPHALIAIVPAALTLAIVFGVMGASGTCIDVGTSLVASIATGAGSEFAMHYLWYLKRLTHEEVVHFVGLIMVLSVVLIGLGFGVLAFGKAAPMRLFGILAASSMLLSAALTFVVVPAFLRVNGGEKK